MIESSSRALDPFDLQRFVSAQAGVYSQVLAELRTGEKRGHWMWFIFPQIRGLGRSQMAERYGLSSLEEAHAYPAHPVLGARLRECTSIVNGLPRGASVEEIFGSPDDLKFHSSMTLFARAASFGEEAEVFEDAVFGTALQRYFGGALDAGTLAKLRDLKE